MHTTTLEWRVDGGAKRATGHMHTHMHMHTHIHMHVHMHMAQR